MGQREANLLFLFCVSLAFIRVGASATRDELELEREGRPVTATVERLGETTRSHQHLVRYTFQLPGDGTTYSASRAGQEDVWASVPESAWKRADAEGTIEVLFLERDPWVNRPSAQDVDPREWLDLTLLAVAFAGLCLLEVVSPGVHERLATREWWSGVSGLL